MHNSQLYTAMFHRMSVRSFSPDPLTPFAIGEIAASLGQIPRLTPQGSVKLGILSPTQVERIHAPHFAVAYAQKDKQSLLEAGWQLEYLDLALFSQGIGSCYNGIAKPHKQYRTDGELTAVMMMALGTPAQPAHRTGPGAFKRKPVAEIACGDVPLFITEAVRIAPSALNAQPWYLDGSRGHVDVYYSPRGIRAKLAASMAYIDMGIALCHLRIAAEKQGFACSFDFDPRGGTPSSKKRELVCTVDLS